MLLEIANNSVLINILKPPITYYDKILNRLNICSESVSGRVALKEICILVNQYAWRVDLLPIIIQRVILVKGFDQR